MANSIGPNLDLPPKLCSFLDLLHSFPDRSRDYNRVPEACQRGDFEDEQKSFHSDKCSHCKFRQEHLYHCNLVADFTFSFDTTSREIY